MRFLVDGMLGGLARWLRIIGQEARYESSAKDSELLQIAETEGRILLTRDAELSHRAGAKKIESLLVSRNTEEERLAQIARTFGISLDISMAQTRCPECGSELAEASKSEVADRVPTSSLRLYDRFWSCSKQECGKVYWLGSHWKQIQQTLQNAKSIAGSNS